MKIRINLNQGETGGGVAQASPAPSPQGAAAAPAASGGTSNAAPAQSSNPAERFGLQLRQALSQSAKPTQPASDGKNTGATANPPEGVDGGQKAEDQSTTAAGEVAPSETDGKGALDKWSEEEIAALKAHGMDDAPFHPATRKLLQSGRELRSQFDRVSASNSNAITEAETIRQAAYRAANGDAEALQKALGVDLKLNKRGPDDILKEYTTYHEEQRNLFQGVITQLEAKGDMQGAQLLLDVGNMLLDGWNKKSNVINQEKEWQTREAKFLEKAGKAPANPEDVYKGLSQKAQNNLAALTQEDPDAGKWYQVIEEHTKPGGALRSLGIDLANGYGRSIQSARLLNQIGKAFHLEKNLPTILAAERKKAVMEHEKTKALGGSHANTQGNRGGESGANQTVQNLGSMFTQMAKRPR